MIKPLFAAMSRCFAKLCLMLVLGAAPFSAFAQADAARVIVKFKHNAELVRRHQLAGTASTADTVAQVVARANALGARLGLVLGSGRAIDARTQVLTASGISGPDLAARLAAEADVEYAVVDERRRHFAFPNDPLFAQGPPIGAASGGPVAGQWYLQAPSAAVASSINASGAWNITTGSASVVVAVLDTGVRPEHPDLVGRLLPGYNMISDIATANDGDGRDADPSDPGDWITAIESNRRSGQFSNCGASDSSWHGTMTTSMVGAASNNGSGMAGVAWNVGLLPVRVLGKCGGYDSDIIAGMQWAAGLPVPGVPANPNPARVISMSLGSSNACPQSYIDAINAVLNKNNPAVVVASAGNSSGLSVGAPANCPGVIAVAGLRHAGTKVGYSDLGPEIAISAPAGNCVNTGSTDPCLYPILAATNTGLTRPAASTYTDAFNSSVGTSFSAPLVAGTAALMLSLQPALTPVQIKALLQSSARPFPSSGSDATVQTCLAPSSSEQLECYCTRSTCGVGMLDAGAAVAAVMSSSAGVPIGPGAGSAVGQYTGLWWNPSESGWGMSLTEHGNTIFAAIYTYDQTGQPSWYVMSNCHLSANSCSGTLFNVTGGSPPTAPWNGSARVVTAVGSGTLVFADSNAAVFTFTVNGITNVKAITREIFASGATAPSVDYSDLWWNANEPGWGVAISQEYAILFATWFTYKPDGSPLWYVVSDCPLAGNSCTGDLYLVTGGTALTTPWDGSNKLASKVGSATFTFSDSANGAVTYTINGVAGNRTITRQPF